jgi:hypothetical protein
MAFVGVVLFAVLAMACAPHYYHLRSIHPAPHGGEDEEYCILETADDGNHPDITLESVALWVTEALYLNGHLNDWDSVDEVYFTYLGDCELYNDDPAVWESIELHIFVDEDALREEVCGDIGCAKEFYCASHPTSDHKDCEFFNLWFHPLALDISPEFTTHAINHEVGHAMGLGDPHCVMEEGNCEVTKDATHCYVSIWPPSGMGPPRAYPVLSVMRDNGYCHSVDRPWGPGDQMWPTHYDREMVRLIVENHPLVADEP